jgi:hypothetical protein
MNELSRVVSMSPHGEPAIAAQAVAAILQQQKAPASDVAAALAAPEVVLATLRQAGAAQAALSKQPLQQHRSAPVLARQPMATSALHAEDGPTVSLADVMAAVKVEDEEKHDMGASQVLHFYRFDACTDEVVSAQQVFGVYVVVCKLCAWISQRIFKAARLCRISCLFRCCSTQR